MIYNNFIGGVHGALLSGNFVSFCSRDGLSPINNNSGVIIVKNRKSCDRQRRRRRLLTIIVPVIIVIYRTSGHLHNNRPLYRGGDSTTGGAILTRPPPCGGDRTDKHRVICVCSSTSDRTLICRAVDRPKSRGVRDFYCRESRA